MVGEKSAEFACGQVLFSLKLSQLNYVVKETPYSVYITLRKSFIREANESLNTIVTNDTSESMHAESVDEVRNKLKEVEKENDNLRQRITDNVKDIGMLEVENEELEVKNKKLETGNIDLGDKMEEMYKEIRHLEQNNSQDEMERVSAKFKNEIGGLEKKLEQNQKMLKDATDTVDILESTLNNKSIEIDKLNAEILSVRRQGLSCTLCEFKCETEVDLTKHILKSHEHVSEICETNANAKCTPIEDDIPSTSNCGSCKYPSESNKDMKMHVNSKHKFLLCDQCDFKTENRDNPDTHTLFEHNFTCSVCISRFRSADKLESHICKLDVDNPSFASLYTRGWFDLQGCNPVNCQKLDQQVVILHCEQCIKNEKSCCWAPYDLKIKTDEVLHLDSKKFIKHTQVSHLEILWPAVVEALN